MAVIATCTVTLAVAVDVEKVETYYYQTASTASAPAKPTTATPSGWQATEYAFDASKAIWTCQKTTLTDGAFYWGSVSKWSAYEGSVVAWNKADAAQSTASGANSRAQRIYYRTASESTAPAEGPTTWVTTATDVYDAWTTKLPPLADSTDVNATKYPHLYTCVQYQSVAQNAAGMTCTCSAVLKDDSITVVDGNMLVNGSVLAQSLDAASVKSQIVKTTELDAQQVTSGTLNSERIDSNTISISQMTKETRDMLDGLNSTVNDMSAAIRLSIEQDAQGNQVPTITLDASEVRDENGDTVVGDDDARFTTVITNKSLQFQEDGQMVTELTDKRLYVTDATVTSTLAFGGYAFIPRSNGNLALKWIGGN